MLIRILREIPYFAPLPAFALAPAPVSGNADAPNGDHSAHGHTAVDACRSIRNQDGIPVPKGKPPGAVAAGGFVRAGQCLTNQLQR